jgi:hypothetical protein
MIRAALRAALATAGAAAAMILLGHPASAALHRAALVVEFSGSPQRIIERCVTFAAAEISGLQLLQRSGLAFTTQDYGGSLGQAVCTIDGVPQGESSCLQGPGGAYWQYFNRSSSGWRVSMRGAGNRMLLNGDMDGWHYAAGAAQSPPSITFSQVCPALPTAGAAAPAVSPGRSVAGTSVHAARTSSGTAARGTPHPTPVARSTLTATSSPAKMPATGEAAKRSSAGTAWLPVVALGGSILLLLAVGIRTVQTRAH